MLRALRNQTQSIFFKIFLVLLICGFALWGVGDLTGGNTTKPVLITDSKEISIDKAINEINRIRYSSASRPSFNEIFENGTYKTVLNKLEQEILLNSEAEELNLNVPMSVVTQTISQENNFKDPLGKFSQIKFNQSLKNAGLSETKYLEMINTEANLKQISTPFSTNDYYSEKVIKKIMDWQNEIRNIEYDFFDLLTPKDIKRPSEETLTNFYEENNEKYQIPLTRNIQYLEISPNYFTQQVKISDSQINERYKIEKSNYKIDEKREILQVTTQDEEKVKKFFKAVGKNNFKELALELFNLSENDINLGLVKKTDLPSTNADALFKANLNEIVGPLKTEFGYNVYKIIKIEPEGSIEYSKIIEDIKSKIIKEKSTEVLFEKLDIIEDLLAEGSNLSEIAVSDVFDKKISLNIINRISQNGIIYSYDKEKSLIEKSNNFLKNIWDTNINEMSDIFNSKEDNYVIIQVLKENKEELPSYEITKNLVYNHWLNEAIIKKSIENIKTMLLNKKSKLSKNYSLKRNNKLGDLNDPYLINEIFNIQNNENNYINFRNKILAVKLLDSKIDNYTFNKDEYQQLNLSFTQSFFNDFGNFYLNHLSSKHNLKRNYKDIENFLTTSN
ncbi:MAG: SurA N-terminal domain-containing protein [Alphaproteobacteria bacterium]|nr:SurA N-terminal domain-containing protein [Alphaproteobacteria bacterium]